MKIAVITHNRAGLNLGGMQRQIEHSAATLEELGHEVVFWNPWDGVADRQFDVAHFFTADHSLLEIHRAFSERGIATVLSPILGGSGTGRFVQRVRRQLALSRLPIYQDLERVIEIVRNAGVVVALHESEEALCRFYGRRGPIVRIPNGVSQVFEKGRPEIGRALSGRDEYFIHVGQFWPNKGQDWLIRHWARSEPLVLVGGVPAGQAEYYNSCRRLAVGKAVKLFGAAEPDSQTLADLIAGARALVLNSRSEVAPIVINEASAAGTAVVMPEHLVFDAERQPQATFRFGDVESFQEALESATFTLGERPVFTWHDVAGKLVELYEGLK